MGAREHPSDVKIGMEHIPPRCEPDEENDDGSLRLEAVDILGASLMDVRLLVLERVE